MFTDKVILLTGGAQGIGRYAAEDLSARGARVAVIDRQEVRGACDFAYQGDLAVKEDIEGFVAACLKRYKKVDGLINNAMASSGGWPDCGWEGFMRAQAIGVAAPYYLCKLLAPHFRPGAAVVNISSTRAFQSQAGTESYSAAKGGITALTHALAVSLRGIARVNAIAPGWIDCSGGPQSQADAAQHPVGRVGAPADIAAALRFLLSDEASFITGQCLVVDGGMSKLMAYHGDQGWRYASPEAE